MVQRGGEQPKFSAYSETGHGAAQVLFEFKSADDNPITQR
jgi:hypothetical protein